MKNLLKIGMVVLVAGVLLISGCISTETVSAAQIKANALQSTESIISYSFIMTGEMDMALGGESVTTSYNANGAIDISNQKLKMEMISSMPGQPTTTELTFYIIDNVLYSKMDIIGDTKNWM